MEAGSDRTHNPPPDVARRYRALFALVAEGIALFEAEDKRLIEANPAFLALLGYAAADLPPLTLYDLIAHDRASIDANTEELIRAGRNASGARDYRRRDGTIVPVEVSATALATVGGAVLCVVIRDLTARRSSSSLSTGPGSSPSRAGGRWRRWGWPRRRSSGTPSSSSGRASPRCWRTCAAPSPGRNSTPW